MQLLPYAIESGFLLQLPMGKFRWAHDQIHAAAYELIPANKKISSHLLIGSRIYMNTQSDQLSEVIFDIVNNMNIGIELMTSQEQRNEVAHLNLTAGKKSMSLVSFALCFLLLVLISVTANWTLVPMHLLIVIIQCCGRVFYDRYRASWQ